MLVGRDRASAGRGGIKTAIDALEGQVSRSRSSCRWRSSRTRTSRRTRTTTRTSPTTSSSATPSRPAASTSPRRRSWGDRSEPIACLNGAAGRPRPRGAGERPMDAGAATLFRMEGVSKRYGGVRALDGADLPVTAGRIHAILGENGAGKSTLIKIMAGVVAPDEGRMLLEGREVAFALAGGGAGGGDRLHLPGAVADPGPERGRQHRHLGPAAALGHDRQAAPASGRRGGAGARRRRRHPPERARADLPLSRQMVEIAKAPAGTRAS